MKYKVIINDKIVYTSHRLDFCEKYIIEKIPNCTFYIIDGVYASPDKKIIGKIQQEEMGWQ